MTAAARIGGAAVFCFLFAVVPAHALELNQAIENCRSTVGKPIVMACMRAGGGSLESCRACAGPKVKACVQSAMLASRPKAALFDAAKVSAPKPGEAAADAAALANKAPASLVAPPRPGPRGHSRAAKPQSRENCRPNGDRRCCRSQGTERPRTGRFLLQARS